VFKFSNLIAEVGAATQAFATGGKHLRAATGYCELTVILHNLRTADKLRVRSILSGVSQWCGHAVEEKIKSTPATVSHHLAI